MEEFRTNRRSVLRGLAAGSAAMLPSTTAAAQSARESDPTTRATFKAIVDAVIPETPELADELGPEHEAGGLEVGLEDYLLAVTNSIFSMYDAPDLVIAAGIDEEIAVGPVELDVDQVVETEQDRSFNLRLAELVAKICDLAATQLLALGGNEETPDPTRFEGGATFASLARHDRLKALSLLDRFQVDTAQLPGPVLETSAALIPQLLVAFTEGIYYSEWQGYDDIMKPPSEREFSETVDGEGLQSWQQTEFPGVIAGSASFRGYWGTPQASLGDGEVWKPFPDEGDGSPPRIYHEPGEYTDDEEYDTSDHEEPFDTSGEPPSGGGPGFAATESEPKRPEDAIEAARGNLDDDLLRRARENLLGQEVDR